MLLGAKHLLIDTRRPDEHVPRHHSLCCLHLQDVSKLVAIIGEQYSSPNPVSRRYEQQRNTATLTTKPTVKHFAYQITHLYTKYPLFGGCFLQSAPIEGYHV